MTLGLVEVDVEPKPLVEPVIEPETPAELLLLFWLKVLEAGDVVLAVAELLGAVDCDPNCVPD